MCGVLILWGLFFHHSQSILFFAETSDIDKKETITQILELMLYLNVSLETRLPSTLFPDR